MPMILYIYMKVDQYSFDPEAANLRKIITYLAENLRNLAFGMCVCAVGFGAVGVAGGW